VRIQTLLLLSALLSSPACTEVPDDPAPPSTTPAAAAGDTDQSRWLLGMTVDFLAGDDATHHFSSTTSGRTATNALVTVSFNGNGQLGAVDASGTLHVGLDPYFAGMRLAAAGTSEVRISPTAQTGSITSYTLEYRPSSTATWVNLCGTGGARVLAGRFDRSGHHEATANRLSWSCTDGVGAKCMLWGYPAGGTGGSSQWLAHQACTRMGRGDYCADGTPHTRTGTSIEIFDGLGLGTPPPTSLRNLTTWPPPPADYYFEAAWRPDLPALCLSRMRWHSIPLGAQCGGSMPDPRQTSTAMYCDQQSTTDLLSHGAVIFNNSHVNDLALETWVGGNDQVTTVRGFYSLTATIPAVIPFPGYTYDRAAGFILRTIPASVATTDASSVSMYLNPTTGDKVLGLTTTPPGLGYAVIGGGADPFEGYVLKAARPDTLPLWLYRNATTGDMVNDTTAPSGYAPVGSAPLGYILQ